METVKAAVQEIFSEVLLAEGPSPELGEASTLYDWLIGSWEAEVIDHDEDGSRRVSSGEWHFAWILEGRAVQDVWISPPRAARGGLAPGLGNRYGTSLRFYDPEIGAWRVTWINPVTRWQDHLVGRREGGDVVQEGRRSDGSRIRWSFRAITPTSFHWTGESSTDEGSPGAWKPSSWRGGPLHVEQGGLAV